MILNKNNKTMKKVMYLLSLILGTALVTGCANDDGYLSNGETTQGNVTEFSTREASPTPQANTRTAGEYTGSRLKFYWTAQDKLWLNTGSNLLQSVRSDIDTQLESGSTTKVPTAKFFFTGIYNNPSYNLRYTGKNGEKDKVTIAATQTQKLPTDASQIGESGDCGTATATKVGNHYEFTLAHKAGYFTIAPYTSATTINGNRLTQIKITANKPIAGTFGFDDNGLNTTTAPQNPSNSITLKLEGTDGNGFVLSNNSSSTANAATFVLAPGSYSTFEIEYTTVEPFSNIISTSSAYYTNVDFNVGANKKLSPELDIRPIKYLFSDGTTGIWAERGTRIPIGIVVIDKVGSQEGTAMALNDAPYLGDGDTRWDRRVQDGHPYTVQGNYKLTPDYNSSLADLDGYKYTWEASGSADGTTIKGNSTTYPAFYAAGHYDPGTPLIGTMIGRKWYLPSSGEWARLSKIATWGNTPNGTDFNAYDISYDTRKLYKALEIAGGSTLYNNNTPTTISGYYWTSSEYNLDTPLCIIMNNGSLTNPYGHYGYDTYTSKGYSQNSVRPFIHF